MYIFGKSILFLIKYTVSSLANKMCIKKLQLKHRRLDSRNMYACIWMYVHLSYLSLGHSQLGIGGLAAHVGGQKLDKRII